jgi:excisionase family DNA binding protein
MQPLPPFAVTPAADHPQEAPPTRGRLLRVRDVAEQLNVDRATVYRLVSSGRLPAYQIGGRGHAVRIDEHDLDAFMEEGA